MMEQRRIIALGVEGPPLSPESSDVVWQSYGQSRGAAFIGLHQRREDDAERVLTLASKATSPDRRLVVKEISVPLKAGKPQIDWHDSFGSEISLMEAGETLVEPSLAKVYERLFNFEEVQDESRSLFFLLSPRRRPTRVRGLKPQHAPLVGRDPEMDRLKELLEQITVDQGQIAGIVGLAGIGKTRLVNSLKEELSHQLIPFVEGHFPLAQGAPYEGFRQIVVQMAGGNIETLSRWEMTDAESDFLRLFLNPGMEVPRLASLDESQIRQGLFYSVRKLVHQMGKHPFVILLDDLHWADPASLELLDYLLEDLESHKILFVLVYRPDIKPTWEKRLNYNELSLAPFPQDTLEYFIRVILGADRVAAKVRDKLTTLSLGNPLYVEELVRQMIDQETIEIETDDEGKKLVRMREDTDLTIPPTLHTLMASRLDRLEEQPKEVLQWAMLLGTHFNAEELEKLLHAQGFSEIESHVATLFDKGYLAEQSVFPKRVNRFTHDLIFETVRGSLGEDERRKRHVVVGDFLENESREHPRETLDRVAEHFLQGDDDLKAINSALAAGQSAFQTHQFLRALHFHREAAKRWQNLSLSTPPVHEIFLPLIRLLLIVGELGEAETAFAQWKKRGISRDPWVEGSYYRLVMTFELHRSRYEDAIEASNMALKAFGSDHRWEKDRYELMPDRISTLNAMGKREQSIHEAFNVLRELNDQKYPLTRMQLWALAGGTVALSGNPELALEYVGTAQKLMTSDMPVNSQIDIWRLAGFVYEHSDDFKNSIKAFTHALDLARDSGLRQQLASVYTRRGIVAEEDGNYTLALEDYKHAIDEARQIAHSASELRSTLGIADTLADIGAAQEGLTYWHEIQPKIEKEKDPYLHGANHSVHSALLELQGDLKGSIQATEKAYEYYAGVVLHSASRVALRKIRRNAQAGTTSIEDLASEFEDLVARMADQKWLFWHFQLKATAFRLAALGASSIKHLDPELDPQTCPVTWIRQELYVTKIKWLDSVGEKEKANKLRETYRQAYDRIAQRVPVEYREAFYKHPLYKVP